MSSGYQDLKGEDAELGCTAPESLVQLLREGWGCNYQYLRRTAKGFVHYDVQEETLRTSLLKNLVVQEVRPVNSQRKCFTVLLQSEYCKYMLYVRNVQGKEVPDVLQLCVR